MNYTTLIDADALRPLLPPASSATPSTGSAALSTDSASASAGSATVVLLDCRFDLTAPHAGRAAYERAHIPGAQYADLNLDLAGPVTAHSGRHPLPEPHALRLRFTALGIAPGVQVVAYDEANGSFAARAWWLLRWLGHREVAVLDGGFKAWLAAGGESEAGAHSDVRAGAASTAGSGAGSSVKSGTEAGAVSDEPTPDRTVHRPPFTSSVDTGAVLSATQVLLALGDPARLLVDARAPERYAGTVEPIDPVAGHVAGAVNHPFADNLAPDGRFLPPDELRRRWRQRLAGKAPQDVMLMCGSGVTACHDLLALEVAGLPGAKLYAGSWSEWIRDPARPITRGSEP